MKKLEVSRFGSLLLIVGLSAAGMSAGIVTFSGADDLTGPTDPHPGSDGAAAALGATSIVDFEGLPLGDFASLIVAPGVTVTLTNQASGSGGIQNAEQRPSALGFNITPGGTQWLQYFPNFNDQAGETITFDFGTPITAFGAYFTDTEVDFPGPITVNFNDGAPQSLPVTKTSTGGGTLFFGFTDTTPFSSVSINGGTTDTSRDIWGIDNVAFTSTPEPGTFGLLLGGTALLGINWLRRRTS